MSVPFSRSTDPGAQTIIDDIPHPDDIAPHMGFSGVYAPTIPSLQHLPPPASATPPTFIIGPVSRLSDTASGKTQGVIGLTAPIADSFRRTGKAGSARTRLELGRFYTNIRAAIGR